MMNAAAAAEGALIPSVFGAGALVTLAYVFGKAGFGMVSVVSSDGDRVTYEYNAAFLTMAAGFLAGGLFIAWRAYAGWRSAREVRELAK